MSIGQSENENPMAFDIDQKEFDIGQIRELALSAISQSLVICLADEADYPIIYVNSAFERLTGYSTADILGHNCRILGGPRTSPETRAEIRAALHDRHPFQGRILNFRKDGGAFWNELTLTPLTDGAGRHYVVGVQSDVTEKQELEARLAEAHRMEAIGKLSGGIAHDFNNMLALIVGNAEIIAHEAAGNDAVAEAAVDIIEAAEGGSNLVKRLLQYARGEGGTAESVCLNSVIADVSALVGKTHEAIRFQIDLSDDVRNVWVDPALLKTALINLLLNARDAICERGVISIRTEKRQNAGPQLGPAAVITVTDNGIGMEKETLARAFEPFYTTKDSGRGNGLGLAMVGSFVKQSGGEILIDSTPGSGTTVTMLLPTEQPATKEALIATPDSGPIPTLVVEDDPKVRTLLARQLGKAGYDVTTVSSAEEALQLIKTGPLPALLLSDIRLRDGMSGVDLLLELKRLDVKMAMALVTAFSEEIELYADELEGIPVVRKPFRTAELLRELEAILHRQS